MCNSLLKPLVQKIKNQDMSVFSIIYSEFEKLIGLYSYRLGYDDAIHDMTLHLIETLYEIDLSNFKADDSKGIKKYIAVSLRNNYIALSIRDQKYKLFSNNLYENLCFDFCNFDDKVSVLQSMDALSDKQKFILVYKYVYGYTDFEIANALDISRQAVNRIKNRGLLALKKFLEGEICDK